MSVVYFVQSGPGGPIKIGVARDVKKRLAQLQTGQPYSLELLAVRPGDAALESRLHIKLSTHRMVGEWFEPHEDVVAEVDYAKSLSKKKDKGDRKAKPIDMAEAWRGVFVGLLTSTHLPIPALARMAAVSVAEVEAWIADTAHPSDEAMANVGECHPTFAELEQYRTHWDQDTPEGEDLRARMRNTMSRLAFDDCREPRELPFMQPRKRE